MATLLQTFALVSILAPNSLEVGSASPTNTTISVPTTLFDKPINGSICSMNPSLGSEKVLGLALQSETLIGWKAPAGCGTACNYMIQYSAPALRCAELAIDEAKRMLTVSQEAGSLTVYNATSLDHIDDYLPTISIGWRTYDTNGKSTVAGTCCSFYNTTQQSVVSFVKNTGIISPSIISYNSLVNLSHKTFIDMCSLGGSRNATFVSLYAYVLVGDWLLSQLYGHLECLQFDRTDTIWSPNIDSAFNLASNNLFSLNKTAGMFTPKSENVSSALEQILVNLTIALITYWGQTTMVDASVVQDQLVWVYHVQRLWIIYTTALAVTAACGAVGFACMLKNGEDSDLTFWDIVWATRNSELDAVVDGGERGDAGNDTMLQYAVQGRDLEANISGIFVLARPRYNGSN